MPYILDLPKALRNRGLEVELVPGWETRSSSSFNPYGAVSHWTAGPRTGDRPSLNIVVNGRPGLSGPLSNVFLTRAGVAVVVAAGRANHAGSGGWRGLVGNSSVFGTEAENSGNGEWTAAQRDAYPRINAAYCDLGGFGPENVCGHNEWAPTRKIDIKDWPMSAMRQQVAALLSPPEPAPPKRKAIAAMPFMVQHPTGDGQYLVDGGTVTPLDRNMYDLLTAAQVPHIGRVSENWLTRLGNSGKLIETSVSQNDVIGQRLSLIIETLSDDWTPEQIQAATEALARIDAAVPDILQAVRDAAAATGADPDVLATEVAARLQITTTPPTTS